jgi:hypothetical protein
LLMNNLVINVIKSSKIDYIYHNIHSF